MGNILLSLLMGADVRLVKADLGTGSRSAGNRRPRTSRPPAGKPYAIPAGASDHPPGGLGFANWAREAEDPVYEGKSIAGLIELVSRGEIDKTSNVFFAHLGGQPAINGYSALFS